MLSGSHGGQTVYETEHNVSDQEGALLIRENPGVVIKPCYAWRCVLLAISVGVNVLDYFWVTLLIVGEFLLINTNVNSRISVLLSLNQPL